MSEPMVNITYKRELDMVNVQTYTASVPASMLEDTLTRGSKLDDYVLAHGELVDESFVQLDDGFAYDYVEEA